MKNLDQLMSVISANPLYNGFFQEVDATYYTEGLQDELTEASREIIHKKRANYKELSNGVTNLEDEIGDVLWVCLSLIEKLHYDGTIDKDRICEHTRNKFLERLPFVRDNRHASREEIETEDYWGQAKEKQKKRGVIQQSTNI